jgi:predicted flap endonuclease-1-like 5' DNA nuclease
MNSGSFSLEPVSQDGVLVTIALVIVAIAAILTVIAMIVGARNKRARRAAEADEQQRIADLKAAGVEAAPPAGTPAPAAAPAPVAAPIAPATAPSPEPTPADQPPAEVPLADEPIAAAAPLDATPASIAADAPSPASATAAAPSADPGAQPVSLLKGLGPKIAARLAELGITRVDQLAWIDDAEAAELDAQLSPFEGRMERDRWREQARLLAGGDRAAYEAQFGKLG